MFAQKPRLTSFVFSRNKENSNPNFQQNFQFFGNLKFVPNLMITMKQANHSWLPFLHFFAIPHP